MLIKKKLPMIILFLVAIPLLLLSSIYYAYVSELLIRENKNRMVQVLNMESLYLEKFFETRKIEVNYLAGNQEVNKLAMKFINMPGNQEQGFRMDNTKLNQSLALWEAESQDVRDIFLLSPYGISIASSNPKAVWMDLSDRQYYKDAMNGKTTISNLIANRLDGETVLVVASPVYDQSSMRVLGVMGNIIDMKYTSDGIRELVNPKVGDAYLLDKTGTIVFHTDKTLIGTTPKNQEVNQYFSKEANQSKEGSKILEENGVRQFVIYTNIPNTEWKLVIEQKMDVITASANRAFYVILLLDIIIVVISGFVGMIYARSITEPITEISFVMNQTKNGELGVRVKYRNKNELGSLSTNLNVMLDQLQTAYKELECKNEELLAQEEELRLNYNDLEKSQTEIKLIQNKYNMALESAKDIVWEWDLQEQTFFVSDLWKKITGLTYCKSKVQKVAFEQILGEEEQERILEELKHHWESKSELISLQFQIKLEEEVIWFLMKASTVWDEQGNPLKTSGILADITKQKEMEERIQNLAFLHQLTKIPNRTAFMYKLHEEFEFSNSVEKKISILQFDIDNFKRINNSLGHKMGDQFLVEVAKRLQLLEQDDMKLFHFAGDEFAFVLIGMLLDSDITMIAKKILKQLSEPFVIENRTINISASMGISSYPNDADSVAKLVQNADTAMFIAKETGKGQYVFFKKIMSESVIKKIEVEEILRRAIKDHLISMDFQPQYSVKQKELIAFEALMRITTEQGIRISPSEFIPVAEETGLIIELGEWALRYVAKKIREWLSSGYQFSHVSVNVSGIQLNQENFIDVVWKIPEEEGIKASYMELEITESILLNTLSDHVKKLQTIKDIGYKIALDDFGTGYSSFNYLKTMPLCTLKIDKSFIDDISTSQKDRELIRQMIEIAHDMDLIVIAEGVEDQMQYDVLNNTTCDYIQGYYFSKPLNEGNTEELLMRHTFE